MTKLSIITICYNIKNSIEKTCESIVNQTWQDFEWIVVDGGSTDGTLDVLNKYKDKIDILISEPDKGVYNAMNKGIKKASGEWLNFMNGGDEFFDNEVLEKVFKDKKYDCGVLYGNAKHLGFDGQILQYPDPINSLYLYGNGICHQASFINKHLFKIHGMYNETYKIVSDLERFLIYLNKEVKFQHLNFPVAIYEGGGLSATNKTLLQKEKHHLYKKFFKNKKALVVESNICHTECIPGYVYYLIQLGYDVDILLNENVKNEYPIGNIFANYATIKVNYDSFDNIINLLNSKEMNKYNICFINSNITYGWISIFKFIKFLNLKTKFICVEHRQENLPKLKQRAIPVVLKSFKNKYDKYEISPFYFGEVKPHTKNDIINFIVAGNIEASRKNYGLLFEAVENLVKNNFINFKITIIGKGDILNIPETIQKHFDIKGRLAYPEMYDELSKADYFLTLLDPENKEHDRYITIGTSGSFQLINSFRLPCIIEDKFAKVHGYNNNNAIVYQTNQKLYDAMILALEQNDDDYQSLKNNLETLSKQIEKVSLYNLKNLLNIYPSYRFSFESIKLMIKMLLKRLLSIRNQRSMDDKWYKVIYILGIKLSFRNRKKEAKARQEQLYNNVNSCLQRIKNCQQEVDTCLQKIETYQKNIDSRLQKIENCQQEVDTCLQGVNKFISENKKYCDELIYEGIFNNLITSLKWIDTKDFVPTMGAANYSLLFILINVLNMVQPKNILELGIGQTSKLTCAYAKYFKDKNLKIIEHDSKWIKKMTEQLQPSDNIQIANKKMIKINYNNTENDIYEDLIDVVKDEKFNLILIDGPYGFRSVYPRMNVLDLLPQNLAEDFVIILDDVERKGEQNTKNLIFKKLNELGIQYEFKIKGSLKSQLVITSKSLSWIHNY